ncbi:MAG TPA: FtsQ-type POTRA domain-containing protein [Longimicrobiales bacterium]|nr:FtsQ-type POTRA domain-containing protein [Longimicrobiales bacterium]
MRRDLKIIAFTVLSAGLWTGGSRVAVAASDLDVFRVTDVEFTGLETVRQGELLALLAVTQESSVWTSTDTWEQRLAPHPMVKAARVRRRMPGTLLVSVEERRPVALVPTPTLEPVDEEGRRLPLDPAERRLDLPVIQTNLTPARGARLLPARDRMLAGEVARLMEADTAFLQLVSEVSLRDRETLVVRWSEPRVEFLLTPGVPAQRLREGLTVLADAFGRDSEHPPTVIDLRFADQVVVRRTR